MNLLLLMLIKVVDDTLVFDIFRILDEFGRQDGLTHFRQMRRVAGIVTTNHQ